MAKKPIKENKRIAVNNGFLADKFSVSIFKDNTRITERTPLPHQEAIETILNHINGVN